MKNLLVYVNGNSYPVRLPVSDYDARTLQTADNIVIGEIENELDNPNSVINTIPYFFVQDCINLWNSLGKIESIRQLRKVTKDMGYYISLKVAKDTMEYITK